jgi:hypothetical protein
MDLIKPEPWGMRCRKPKTWTRASQKCYSRDSFKGIWTDEAWCQTAAFQTTTIRTWFGETWRAFLRVCVEMPPQCPEAFKLLFDIINSTQYLLVENHFRKFSNVRLYKKKKSHQYTWVYLQPIHRWSTLSCSTNTGIQNKNSEHWKPWSLETKCPILWLPD